MSTDALTASTLEEYGEYLDAGCEPMTPSEYLARVEELGYTLITRYSNGAMGRYVNTGNARAYRALGVTYTDTRTGHGYANIHADRTRLPELQALRRNSVVMSNGYLWEL